MSASKDTGRLTTKQQRFVDFYNGNGVEAARKAGYKGNDETLASVARENLRKPHIKKAIEEREKKRTRRDIAGRERLQAFWTKTMCNTEEPMKNRLKASELLGRSHAMFTDKVQHDGELHITVIDRYENDGHTRNNDPA